MSDEILSTAWRSFRFRSRIGSGGFGEVYQAELITAGGFAKIVAVKVLRQDYAEDVQVVGRLRDEARLLGQLRHPSIVQADDLVYLAGRLAIVMEYVPGANWIAVIDPRTNPDPVPPAVVLAVIRRVAEALAAAWDRPSTLTGEPLRVLHRDIKPSNIRITPDGEVKVLDFGVARAEFLERETQTQDLLIGSFPYMAPDVFLRMPAGPAQDVYSLGVTFFESVARFRLGRCGVMPEQQAALVRERLAAIDTTPWGAVGSAMKQLLAEMLDYEPEKRPTAAQVVDRVQEMEQQVGGPRVEVWARQEVERVGTRSEEAADGEFVGRTLSEDSSVRSHASFVTTTSAPQPPRKRGFPWILVVSIVLALVTLGGVVYRTLDRPVVAPAAEIPPASTVDLASLTTPDFQPTTQVVLPQADPEPVRPVVPASPVKAPTPAPVVAPVVVEPPPAAVVEPPAPAPASTTPVPASFSSSPFGVGVTLDGAYRGTTPLRISLPPGKHHVIFDFQGSTHAFDVEVKEGDRNLWTYSTQEGALR